jgi:hypothetical protein
MSGIMTAMVGTVTASSIIYGAGLYNTTTGVNLSPITGSATNIVVEQTWIGYFKATTTGSVTLSIQTTRSAGSGGGSASTDGRLWFGDIAKSGFNDSNNNIYASGNQTTNTAFSVANGVYYPIRIRWNGTYDEGFFGSNSSGSITFFVAGSSNVSDKIFYNILSNGF